jgi:hypothetical protein
MGSTHSGASISQRAMIEDSTEEFFTALSPSPRRRNTGASLTPTATTPWMENAPAMQAMMMVPPCMTTLWLETNLPVERRHDCHEGQQAQARAWHPTTEQEAVPR